MPSPSSVERSRMRQKQGRQKNGPDDPPSSSSSLSLSSPSVHPSAASTSTRTTRQRLPSSPADSTELSLVQVRSSATPAKPTFHLPFREVPFSLPEVTLDDPTAASRSVVPRQLTARSGSAPSPSVSRPLSQFEVTQRIYKPEEPNWHVDGGSGAGAGGAGGTHYLVLQQQWEEEQRQLRRQLDPKVQKQQLKAQKLQEQRQRRVTEGVAAVLCALPNNAGTGLDDPVADKYSEAFSAHGRRMKDLAEARRFRKAVAVVGNDRAKSKLIERLTLTNSSADVHAQSNNKQHREHGNGGDDLEKPRDTIKLLEQWKEDLQDMLQPKPKTLQSSATLGNNRNNSPASPKSLRTLKKESKLLPVVDLRSSTLAREQQLAQAQGPSALGQGSGPRSRQKSREGGGGSGTPGPLSVPQDHVYGFYGDRADDDADVFTGNPLPVEVQAQLRRRVDEFVGTGMWNDPVGSTIAQPLTIDSFTQGGKHRFQFTQRAHDAASIIRQAWLNYADKRRSAALRIQAIVRGVMPRRALAHKLFLRFHAVRRAQAVLKGWYKHRCRMSVVVQAVGRMWIRRRRLLGVVKVQRLVKVVLKRKHAALVLTRMLRWRSTRKRIERVRAARNIQKAYRAFKYRVPIMIQAQFRGFVQRVAFQQRLLVRHRSELQRRIREDLYVVENVHVSFAKALDFLNGEDGKMLEEAMWQRCRAEHEDKLDRIAKLPTELAQRDERILLEFDTFDLDGSGAIDVAELEFLLRELAIFMEPNEVEELMRQLDTDGNGAIHYEEYRAWRWDYNQFQHNFDAKAMFSSGPEGFAAGFRGAFRLLSKQTRRMTQRNELRAARRRRDKEGMTGRRIARARIVRTFIRLNKKQLRKEFRALDPANQPPFACERCLQPFMSRYRLDLHQAQICGGATPTRPLPGDLQSAQERRDELRQRGGEEPGPAEERIAALHTHIPRVADLVQRIKQLRRYDAREEKLEADRAKAEAGKAARMVLTQTRWGKLQVSNLASARKQKRLAFERTLFVPAKHETRVQRLQRKRSIKRYQAELMFKRFDIDASGELDLNELEALLNELGMLLDAEDLAQVAAQIDTDQSGTVDIAEFVEWYAAARVIGRSLSERSRMDLAKLRSGVLDVWRRVITNEVDVLGATYDLVQKARAKAAVAARKRYRETHPKISNVLDFKVDEDAYNVGADDEQLVGAVFDGLLDFDVDTIIADATEGRPVPDFLRNLAADAKLARKDWEEVQRRKELQARIAEDHLPDDAKAARRHKRELDLEKRRAAREALLEKEAALQKAREAKVLEQSRRDAAIEAEERRLAIARERAASVQVAPETVALVSVRREDEEDLPVERSENATTASAQVDEAAPSAQRGEGRTTDESDAAAMDEKRKAIRERQAERERIAEAEKKQKEIERVFRQAESLRKKEQLEVARKKQQREQAAAASS